MSALQSLSSACNHHPDRMTSSGFIGTLYYDHISNTVGKTNKTYRLEKEDDLEVGKKPRKQDHILVTSLPLNKYHKSVSWLLAVEYVPKSCLTVLGSGH